MTQFSEAIGQRIADVCRKYKIRELSLFGSRARGDNKPDSDFDLLVEFLPDARIDLFAYSDIKFQLEDLLKRNVDLVPKAGLKKRIKQRVLSEAQNIYAG